MKRQLKEEQYSSNINVGTFRTKEQAQSYLQYLRKKYGFSEYNSYVNGTTVVVTLEKSVMDDSYYYDMINAIKQEKQRLSNYYYKQVSESTLRKMIRKALINEMNANKLPSNIEIKDFKTDNGGKITVRFGKNGWGLTNELIKIGELIHKLSQRYNVYLEECKIDKLDDVYDFVFHYDNKNFED